MIAEEGCVTKEELDDFLTNNYNEPKICYTTGYKKGLSEGETMGIRKVLQIIEKEENVSPSMRSITLNCIIRKLESLIKEEK